MYIVYEKIAFTLDAQTDNLKVEPEAATTETMFVLNKEGETNGEKDPEKSNHFRHKSVPPAKTKQGTRVYTYSSLKLHVLCLA